MLDLTFNQQLTLTLIDKAVIGGLLAFAVFGFNRMLEGFRAGQSRQLEEFRSEQSRNLERIRSEQTRDLEAFKYRLVSEGEFSRNVRNALADVARKLAAGNHTICWLCWAALYAPDNVTREDLDAYDRDIHQIFSELVGARAVLAAVDADLHQQVSPLVDDLYRMDVKVGEAMARYATSPEEALAALGELHQPTQGYDARLIDILSTAERSRAAAQVASVVTASTG